MQNKGMLIVAGCVVLLCLCLGVAGAAVFDVPGRVAELSRSLGGNAGISDPTLSPSTGAATRAPATPAGAPTPTRVVAAPTSPVVSTPTAQNPLANFLSKAKTANKYRIEFVWIFGSTEKGNYQEVTFFNMTGQVDGKNSYLSSKGGLLGMLGSDQNATIEFIQADGKSYVRGLSLFGMADPKQWYVTDDSMASTVRDFADPDEFMDYSGGAPGDFKKVRTEVLEDQSCEVWLYDFKGALVGGVGSLLSMAKDQGDLSVITVGQTSVWLCADGFIRKWMFELRGHDAKNPNEKGAIIMTARMWDYNNPAITVTAPPNAKPMPGSR